MIYDHTREEYKVRRQLIGAGKWNGAYYYSREIVRNIIPRIETGRNWITLNVPGMGRDHSIVFVHNNIKPETYAWLKQYRDLILVCGVPETCEKVKHIGKTLYLPLSVDVKEVERFKAEKTKEAAFAGRAAKLMTADIPEKVDIITGKPRGFMLEELARYKRVYAVGRTAIEAKILGCEVMPYDPRYPDPERWQILDNKEAAAMLQLELDKIDRPWLVKTPVLTKTELPSTKATKAELLEYCELAGVEADNKMTKANIWERIKLKG